MRFIDADAEVTVLVYDAEYEENSVKKMTLEEMCEAYTEEGCPIIISELMENKWIPCSEKLPDTSGSYLCTCSDGHTNRVTMLTFLKRLKAWNLTGTRAYWKVIAWTPLPEPYSE